MSKIIDYFLFRIVLFFQKDKHFNQTILLIIWIIAFNVADYCLFLYAEYNGEGGQIHWYNILLAFIFIISYFRTKWIMRRIEKAQRKKQLS